MAKSGAVEEAVQTKRMTAEELKRELRRLLNVILDEDEARAENYDDAVMVITALRELRTRAGTGIPGGKRSERDAGGTVEIAISKPAPVPVPEKFICPLSSEIIRDPVVIATGVTYDRAYIQEWLNSGNRTCPQTQQVLPNTILTPNHLASKIISKWCSDHGVDLVVPKNPDTEGLITSPERCTFLALLAGLSSSSPVDRKHAVKSLRQVTKRNRSFRALAGEEPAAITHLLSILSNTGDDLELKEDAVTAVLNISIHDANKQPIGESEAISLLIKAIKSGGTMNTLANAAAALFSLSALDSNKEKIGQLGAIPPLIDLFETGSSAARKDAASAIFNLCLLNENKVRAVKSGAVASCLRVIGDSSSDVMDESLALLALLSADQEAAVEVADAGGVALLLTVLRNGTSPRNQENAVVVLYAACSNVRWKLKEIGEEELLHSTISNLMTGGTSRTMRKAAGILEKLRRSLQGTHYSC